jgi:hypothetical protein
MVVATSALTVIGVGATSTAPAVWRSSVSVMIIVTITTRKVGIANQALTVQDARGKSCSSHRREQFPPLVDLRSMTVSVFSFSRPFRGTFVLFADVEPFTYSRPV